jgi:hypothetical protein
MHVICENPWPTCSLTQTALVTRPRAGCLWSSVVWSRAAYACGYRYIARQCGQVKVEVFRKSE